MAYIAYCGDDCESCPRYMATKSNDVRGLEAAAILWQKAGYHDRLVPPEEMICHGCHSLEQCYYGELCECARGRGIGNCGECTEFPCDRINAVFDKTSSDAVRCKGILSTDEYECLYQAFFSKKDRLETIHSEYVSGAKQP
jgi:hypothetical protein